MMPAKTESAIYNPEFQYFTTWCPFCKARNTIIELGSEFQESRCEHFRRFDFLKEEAVFYQRESGEI